jgi:hypothetical protein
MVDAGFMGLNFLSEESNGNEIDSVGVVSVPCRPGLRSRRTRSYLAGERASPPKRITANRALPAQTLLRAGEGRLGATGTS